MSLRQFILQPNGFLRVSVNAYYILDYLGYQEANNPDFINHLKNPFGTNNQIILKQASEELHNILSQHDEALTKMMRRENIDTICIVPRSKKRVSYAKDQLFFLLVTYLFFTKTSSYASSCCYSDIVRHTDTRTTHLDKSGYGGNGELPYVGITKDTCTIETNEIKGKNILLIDDIYTKTVNIDEDCLQALLDNGAKKVVLLAIARTFNRNNHIDDMQNYRDNIEQHLKVLFG
mgnify:CR=1 FL=1